MTQGVAALEAAARFATEAGEEALAAAARFDRALLRCLAGEIRRGIAEMSLAALPTLMALPAAERAHLPNLTVRVGGRCVFPARIAGLLAGLTARFDDAFALGQPLLAPGAVVSPRGSLGLGVAWMMLGQPSAARRAPPPVVPPTKQRDDRASSPTP